VNNQSSPPHRTTRFIALRTAPEDFLYPLLAHGPRESSSAETILDCRDGDRVVQREQVFLKRISNAVQVWCGEGVPTITTG
jgi:hypothetical protein